jgi:hypothetical protein
MHYGSLNKIIKYISDKKKIKRIDRMTLMFIRT